MVIKLGKFQVQLSDLVLISFPAVSQFEINGFY